jgi:hypothetical protein
VLVRVVDKVLSMLYAVVVVAGKVIVVRLSTVEVLVRVDTVVSSAVASTGDNVTMEVEIESLAALDGETLPSHRVVESTTENMYGLLEEKPAWEMDASAVTVVVAAIVVTTTVVRSAAGVSGVMSLDVGPE